MSDQAWYRDLARPINHAARTAAEARNQRLTKPAGSLGRLESIAVDFAGWQGDERPGVPRPVIRIFAGDHGVCSRNVSAYPQEVTAQMIANFLAGGAAISVLATQNDADLGIVNLGTVVPESGTAIYAELVAALNGSGPRFADLQLMPGTDDFVDGPAMPAVVCEAAMAAGRDQVTAVAADGPSIFVGGEMGIGNTTAASALCSLLLDLPPSDTVGPGTGVTGDALAAKRDVVQQALDRHRADVSDAVDGLARLGGLEIAGLVGAYIACAQQGIPVLVDGFITSAAAVTAVNINPGVAPWLCFSHRSAEPAHVTVLRHLNAEPLVDFGMRLGEGSGSALVVPLLQSAVALHSQMATFDEAGVSDQ